MAKIPFTLRELTNAWREASRVANITPRSNPHKLLLFYAVECGLKAVYLKSKGQDVIDGNIAGNLQHNINKIATLVNLSSAHHIPSDLTLSVCKIKNQDIIRKCGVGELNQVWRYGGKLLDTGGSSDAIVESKLLNMNQWISKELR
ncbi:hypothetical protein NL402_11750 [Serratia marcescens]|uniref:hypothetical protein n=1 Tax=Serratia marcescens TaxID=615 RepID=UPI0025A3ACA2|nr:hypothetical protein [Serratia marcescens]MDM8341469.1 hypothetical protein [Serratia marcescens]